MALRRWRRPRAGFSGEIKRVQMSSAFQMSNLAQNEATGISWGGGVISWRGVLFADWHVETTQVHGSPRPSLKAGKDQSKVIP